METKIFKAHEKKSKTFDDGPAQGVTGRILIGRETGAENFCMRLFELAPEGHTPSHTHDWEHEIFFHNGQGELLANGVWKPVGKGSAAFVPGGVPHQIRNTGTTPLTFICLVPNGAPEL